MTHVEYNLTELSRLAGELLVQHKTLKKVNLYVFCEIMENIIFNWDKHYTQ